MKPPSGVITKNEVDCDKNASDLKQIQVIRIITSVLVCNKIAVEPDASVGSVQFDDIRLAGSRCFAYVNTDELMRRRIPCIPFVRLFDMAQ